MPSFTSGATRGYKTELHPLRDGIRWDDNSASRLIETVKTLGGNAVKLSVHARRYFEEDLGRLEKIPAAFPVVVPPEFEEVIDTSLLSDGKQYCLGIYNASYDVVECDLVVDIPVDEGTFALDVKAGHRCAFDGKLHVTVPPRSAGFYLVGDADLTAIPEVRPLKSVGGCADVGGMQIQTVTHPILYRPKTGAEKPKESQ